MVIDCILDRYDGNAYNPREFYYDMMSYRADDISRAMDFGEEEDIKKELKKYIIKNRYNIAICDFIDSVDWLEPDSGKDYRKSIDIMSNKPKDDYEYDEIASKHLSALEGRSNKNMRGFGRNMVRVIKESRNSSNEHQKYRNALSYIWDLCDIGSEEESMRKYAEILQEHVGFDKDEMYEELTWECGYGEDVVQELLDDLY